LKEVNDEATEKAAKAAIEKEKAATDKQIEKLEKEARKKKEETKAIIDAYVASEKAAAEEKDRMNTNP